jgi:glutamate formiminotransferase
VIECVVNISEGRRRDVIEAIAATAGTDLLDQHVDADHNRSVLTTVGEDGVRAIAAEAVARLDLRRHQGAHPRIGVVDVVPFVALDDTPVHEARRARDAFARWAGDALGVPCFLYGPERTLPEIRRGAFTTLAPDTGPTAAHPSAGAMAVGVRPVLVAYNLWLAEPDLDLARRIANDLRSPAVRALGLPVGDAVQVSMNLIDPMRVGPAQVYARVAARAPIERAELVGLVPGAVLDAIDPSDWERLDLARDRTIESRIGTPR